MALLKSLVVVAEHVLLVIDVFKGEPECDCSNVTNNGWATKNPSEVWISDESREGKSKCVSDTLGQKIQGGDQTTHVYWSAGVCNTIGRNVDKELGKSADGVWECDPPDRDRGKKTVSVRIDARRGATIFPAGACLISIIVEHGITSTTDCSQKQTSSNTRNWTISDAPLAEQGVQSIVQDRSRDNDQDGVEVLKKVVGHSIACQHGIDAVSCGPETIVVDSLNGEKAEHSAGLKCSTNILDEVVIPRDIYDASAGCDDAGFCRLPKTMTTDFLPISLQAHADNFATPSKVASPRRVNYESRLYPEKDCW